MLPGFYANIAQVSIATDSTFLVTASVISHPTSAYDGFDIQLGDVLYSRPVIVGDDCNRYAIDSIVYQFSGTIRVRVVEQQDKGQPATGINAFIRENSVGSAHWISDIGSPLNQCISGRLSARIPDYSWYAKDSLGNVVEVLSKDTVLLSTGGIFQNTDEQFVDVFTVQNDSLKLSLSNSDTLKAVDLSPYLDNTDSQNLGDGGRVGTTQTVTISNGNPVSFSVADNDNSPTNELNTSLNLVGTVLQLTDAGGTLTSDLSSLQDGTGTDDQQITAFAISNDTLTISLEDGGSLSVYLGGYLDNTDTVNDADSVVGNELQTLIDGGSSGINRTISLSDGGGSVTFSVADNDNSSTNELNSSFNLSGDTLTITDNGGSLAVLLSKYLDDTNTDRQGFKFSTISPTVQQVGLDSTSSYFRLAAGENVSISRADSTITISAQTVSILDSVKFANDSLYLYFGEDSIAVELGVTFTDTDTDKQKIDTFQFFGDSLLLSVERDSQSAFVVDLNKYLDNTDSQALSVVKVGNVYTVSLDDSPSIQIDVTDNDNSSSNEFNTGVNLVGTTLQITDGGGTLQQDLSSLQDGVGLDTSGYNTQFYLLGDSLIIVDANGSLYVDLNEYRDSASLIDLVNDADSVPTNELQSLLDFGKNGTNQTIGLTLGGGTVTFSVADLDNDPENELIRSLYLQNDTLFILEGGELSKVDLSQFLDDTDTDNQGFVVTTESITTERIGLDNTSSAFFLKEGENITLQRNDSTITISAAITTIFDTVYFADSLLYLVIDGDTTAVALDISAGTDTSGYNQSFTRIGDTLYIADANSTLAVYAPIGVAADRADTSGYNNALYLSGNTLFLGDANDTLSVNLPTTGGSFSMPLDSVTFTNNSADVIQGELQFDDELGFLKYGGLGDSELRVNQDVIWLVKNQTGEGIPKGRVVRAAGTLGASGRILVTPMDASNLALQEVILGITKDSIPNGADGYVVERGKIRNIDMSGYLAGAILYADPAVLGGLTDSEPAAGNLKQPIAFVVHNVENGTLAVRVKTGEAVGQLHDVAISSPQSGEVLAYSGGIWSNVEQRDSQTLAAVRVDSVTTVSISSGNSIQLLDTSGHNRVFALVDTILYIIDDKDSLAVSLAGLGSDTTFVSNITNIIGDTAQATTVIDTIVIQLPGGDTTIYVTEEVNSVLYSAANGIRISGSEITLGNSLYKPWTTIYGQTGNENLVFSNLNNIYLNGANNYQTATNSTIIASDNSTVMIPYTGSSYGVYLNNGTKSAMQFNDGVQFAGTDFTINNMDVDIRGLTVDSLQALDYVIVQDAGTQQLYRALDADVDNQKLSLSSKIDDTYNLSISNGNTVQINVQDGDFSAANEVQDIDNLTLTGTTLAISLEQIAGNTTVDLAPLLITSDTSATNELITSLNLSGTTLQIVEGGQLNQLNLAALQDGTGTDDQTIDQFQIISNTLYLSLENDGQAAKTVSLAPYLDNTDAQDLNLSGNTLSLTGDPTTVSLAPYLDNTDDQTASEVPYMPIAGKITSTNVQDAIEEVFDSIGNASVAIPSNELAYGTGTDLTSSSNLQFLNGNRLNINGSPATAVISAKSQLGAGQGLVDLRTGLDTLLFGISNRGALFSSPIDLSTGNKSHIYYETDLNNANLWIGTGASWSPSIDYRIQVHTDDYLSISKSYGNEPSGLRLKNGNKLGINVNTPTSALHVGGDSRFTGAIFDSTNSSGTAGQVLTSNGNNAWSWEDAGADVAITNTEIPYGTGTGLASEAALRWFATSNILSVNSPPSSVATLSLKGSGGDVMNLYDSNNNKIFSAVQSGFSVRYDLKTYDFSGNPGDFRLASTNGNPYMYFTTDGNEIWRLQNSDLTAGSSRFSIQSIDDASEGLHIEEGGKIGINDATPAYALDVTGDIGLTGRIYDSADDAGTAGQILSSTGTGVDWIDAPTGGAGTEPKVGVAELAFGDTDSTLTSDNNLTWNGKNLKVNSSSSSVLIGRDAGLNVTGLYNVALGRTALYSTTSGADNMAIGVSAMYYSQTTSRNVVVGNAGLFFLGSGDDNVSIGNRSLQFAGNYTTAFSAQQNVAIGAGAGRYTNSANNVNLEDVNNSVLVGYNTTPGSSSVTNAIVIGHQAEGIGSNGTVIGNSSTTTTKLYGVLDLQDDINDSNGSTGNSKDILTSQAGGVEWKSINNLSLMTTFGVFTSALAANQGFTVAYDQYISEKIIGSLSSSTWSFSSPKAGGMNYIRLYGGTVPCTITLPANCVTIDDSTLSSITVLTGQAKMVKFYYNGTKYVFLDY